MERRNVNIPLTSVRITILRNIMLSLPSYLLIGNLENGIYIETCPGKREDSSQSKLHPI